MTKNGKLILEIIENSTFHPTAEDVYRIASEQGTRMSLATVYNNLARLCDDRMIRRLTNAEQPDRYDKMIRHDHLVCRKCGKISDLFIKDLTEELEREAGFKFTSYDLKLEYECEECR